MGRVYSCLRILEVSVTFHLSAFITYVPETERHVRVFWSHPVYTTIENGTHLSLKLASVIRFIVGLVQSQWQVLLRMAHMQQAVAHGLQCTVSHRKSAVFRLWQ